MSDLVMFPASDREQVPAKLRVRFCRALLAWYDLNARKLPWRGTQNAYRIWVSEIMLQQTQVAAVLEHYREFLSRFPTIFTLALAPEEEVLAAWSGLGYYRRARLLHRAAKFLVANHNGNLPHTATELRKLPGIGDYTSAAIASIAFGEPVAVVDGNVERVLLRLAGEPERPGSKAAFALRTMAQRLLCNERPGDSNQAMMELGATVCLPRAPLCLQCPVCNFCSTRGEHPTLPRAAMRSERISVALVIRQQNHGLKTLVLLRRRPNDVSLMPGMLELPVLLTADAMEPILRLRHSILGTNYYVEVHAFRSKHTLRRLLDKETQQSLEWIPLVQLRRAPLTGLAQKILKRMGMIPVADQENPETPPLARTDPTLPSGETV